MKLCYGILIDSPKTKFQWVSDAFDNKKYAFAADYKIVRSI